MKTPRLILLTIVILLGITLSSCAGAAGAATSWPGLTVHPDGEVAYLANGPQVYAVNLTNGTERWHYPLERDNKISFYAAPALTEDDQLIVGSYDNLLYSLDPENGGQRWIFDGSEDRYIGGPLNGEMIYAPSSDNKLYALNSSGRRIWDFATEDALWATPVRNGQTIYQPSMDQRVYALDAQTGELIWKTDQLGGSVAGNPTLSSEGLLYVGTFGNELLALDTNQGGKIIWRLPASGWVWSGPAMTLDDDTLYVGDLEGILYKLDAKSGAIKWQIQPDTNGDRAITERPLVLDDTVYFGSESGFLFAVDAETGNPRWSIEIGGQLYAGPKSAGDLILVAPLGTKELLVALNPDGNRVWTFAPEN